MKILNENNIYKALLSLSCDKNKIENIYLKNIENTTKKTIIKFNGFPDKVIEKQVSKALNNFGKSLFLKGFLNLTYADKKELLDSSKVKPILRKKILNVVYEDDEDDDYDELKMFEDYEFYGIVANFDYKKNFKDYKDVIEQRERLEHGLERKVTKDNKSKNKNRPQIKNNK